MGRKKKEVNELQTKLFTEDVATVPIKENTETKESDESVVAKPKKGRKSGVIPFFLHSSFERKKAHRKRIDDNFSDETYKHQYVSDTDDTVPVDNETKPIKVKVEPKPKKEKIVSTSRVKTNKTETDGSEPQVTKTRKIRTIKPKSGEVKLSVKGTKKSNKLKRTKKRLIKAYTDKYDSDIPDDIVMSSKEKREFKKEIDDINEQIQMVERDDAEIEYIPTELKNTYTVFRDAAVKHTLLTADEEKALSKRIEEGDEEAFNTFVEANYRLVIACAKQIYNSRGKSSILDYMDIIQEGIMGLLIAVSKFDWRHNTRFSTYGVPWIYQRINRVTDSQRNGLSIPGYAGYCVRRMNEDIRKYQAGTLDETDMKASEIKRMKELSMISTPMIAIDPASDPEDNQGTISPELLAVDSVKDDSAILSKIEEEHYQDKFHNVLRNILKPDEYDMLCQRHGMGEYAGNGTASLRLLSEARDKSIEYTRLQIESIEKKIHRSSKLRKLNKEWFSTPPME